MIIVAGGDSFVFGSELSDYVHNVTSSKKTFTALLAKNAQYECVAWPGYANDSIARNIINECSKHDKCGVIVSWTFPGRYEFRFNFNTGNLKSPWYALNSWILNTPESLFSNFNIDDEKIQKDLKTNHSKASSNGITEFAETFYKCVGSSEYWEVYSSLKEIVYLQNYLKVRKIPYLFTCADNNIYFNSTVDNADISIKSLLDQIDMNHWFWFPAGTHSYETTTPRGFYQWAVENKYPMGTLHPLEEAHAAAAKIIKEKFNELVTKPLEQN